MLLALGIDIKRAVLAFWVGYAAAELHPLWLRLRQIILTAGRSRSTKLRRRCWIPAVAAPRRASSGRSRVTIGRGGGGTGPPAVAYTYAPGRGAVHALKLLEGYHGIVQCDGYAAYKTIANAASEGRSRWHPVGLICDADSSKSRKTAIRRSLWRR